jgi:hypothetical protein
MGKFAIETEPAERSNINSSIHRWMGMRPTKIQHTSGGGIFMWLDCESIILEASSQTNLIDRMRLQRRCSTLK